jgi:hypothetical protein
MRSGAEEEIQGFDSTIPYDYPIPGLYFGAPSDYIYWTLADVDAAIGNERIEVMHAQQLYQ